ncbi:hypothetical protein Tco_0626556 [Tanacetum coccineum]|uniref:Uncharacterized protein n=1 Tax=Tanacetum coccineum TaxID=301880 RepID=A0ABQ4WJX5_9ASTR
MTPLKAHSVQDQSTSSYEAEVSLLSAAKILVEASTEKLKTYKKRRSSKVGTAEGTAKGIFSAAEDIQGTDEEIARKVQEEEQAKAMEQQEQERRDLEVAKELQRQLDQGQETDDIDWSTIVKQVQERQSGSMIRCESRYYCLVDWMISTASMLDLVSTVRWLLVLPVVNDEFMQLSLIVMEKLKEKIRAQGNEKIQKITKYPDTEEIEPPSVSKSSESLFMKMSLCNPKFAPPKPLRVRYVHTIFPSLPLVRKSTFGFKPEDVEETIGILMEVEPLDETQLEDLGLKTYNHDIPLSYREVPSFDEPEPQPKPLPDCPSLDVSQERGPEPPIKPNSPDNFRMKVVDHLTIHTPPSPHMASFYPRDVYFYYHPCLDDLKKHYGFKLGLLGQSGSLGVDFLDLEVIDNDFLREGYSLPLGPKELEKGRIKETYHSEHIMEQPLSHHKALSYHNGVYRYYHPHLTLSVREPSLLTVK